MLSESAFHDVLSDAARQGEALLERARVAFANQHGLVLFGGGGFAKKVVQILSRNGHRIHAIVDRNPAKWGGTLEGVPVIGPGQLTAELRACTAVVSVCGHIVGYPELAAVAIESGFPDPLTGTLMFWLYPSQLLPFFSWSTPRTSAEASKKLYATYQLFSDDTAREQFVTELCMRSSMNFQKINTPDVPGQYFPPFLKLLGANEIFVDGGAYDGDTMRSYLERRSDGVGRWYALEPDPGNGARFLQLLNDTPKAVGHAKLLPYGLSDSSRRARFNASGVMTAAVSDSGDTEIELRPLDALVTEPITFLKLDIEGGELQALEGARQTLARSPDAVLAIAGYHAPDDFSSIPALMKELRPNARFGCKSHGHFGFDFVFYAVPENRWVDSQR